MQKMPLAFAKSFLITSWVGLMLLLLPLSALAQETTSSPEATSTTTPATTTPDGDKRYVTNTTYSGSNCDSVANKKTFEEYTKGVAENGSPYIAVEMAEPLLGIQQKIQTGSMTISEVAWKFNCTVSDTTVTYSDGSEEHLKSQNISFYVPYEKNPSCPAPPGVQCSLVQILKGTSGSGLIKTYIAIIYRWAAGVVGIVAVLVIVLSGIQISLDQGGGESVSASKTRIMQSLAALAVLFLSALILYTINPTFFQK